MLRLIPLVILLAACTDTSIPEDVAATPQAASVELAFCKGEPFADSVGQPVSSIQADLPERARILGPDDIATQDYRIDRLNVYVNGAGIVQRLACG